MSWAVTIRLIFAFVFAYAKSRFSHGMADVYIALISIS